MKIYVNYKHEIKDLYETTDTSLIEYTVDRDRVFGDFSDLVILSYCYKELDCNEFLIYQYKNVSELINLENKISILEKENKLLKQELSITQDAVNELIFNSLNI